MRFASGRTRIGLLVCAGMASLLAAITAKSQNATPQPSPGPGALPYWAYPVNLNAGRAAGANRGAPANGAAPAPTAPPPPANDSGEPKHVPGSAQTFTLTYISNLFTVPDWFPDSHPMMPAVVSNGNRQDNVQACGYCHLPNGYGRPENASVAGLPVGYFLNQIADFKAGLRKGSEPRMGSVAFMVRIGTNVSEADAKAAAEYFASIPLKPWIRVVETDQVPVTKANNLMLQVVPNGGSEPIGERVIEVPEDTDRVELRDSSSGFIAYVPKGSVERGHQFVATGGNGKTIRCAICHGPDLKGLGNVPPLAGRSPSQMARQIIDIQNGVRNGPDDQLMKEPVRQLTNADIVNITAYLASLKP